MSKTPTTNAPPLSDEAWKFLEAQNVDALNGGITFEGDWGNWNWLWAEIYKRSTAPQATRSAPIMSDIDEEGRARLNALLPHIPAGEPLLHSAADEIELLRTTLKNALVWMGGEGNSTAPIDDAEEILRARGIVIDVEA